MSNPYRPNGYTPRSRHGSSDGSGDGRGRGSTSSPSSSGPWYDEAPPSSSSYSAATGGSTATANDRLDAIAAARLAEGGGFFGGFESYTTLAFRPRQGHDAGAMVMHNGFAERNGRSGREAAGGGGDRGRGGFGGDNGNPRDRGGCGESRTDQTGSNQNGGWEREGSNRRQQQQPFDGTEDWSQLESVGWGDVFAEARARMQGRPYERDRPRDGRNREADGNFGDRERR